jgi:hypothetical protein
MATKPQLSREYLYVPFTNMNFDVADLIVNGIAFMAQGVEPAEIDWIEALVVDSLDPLYVASIGEGIALLVGPLRGDVGITTEDLALGDYQVWVDAAVAGSDERIVRVAGTLTVNLGG